MINLCQHVGNKHILSRVCSLVQAFGEQLDSLQWKVQKSFSQQCLFPCVAKRKISHIVLQEEICEGNVFATLSVIVKKNGNNITISQEKNGQLNPSLTNELQPGVGGARL